MIEISSLFLITLSIIDIVFVILYNDPFQTGNAIIIAGQILVIYGSVIYGAYYWMNKEPRIIKKSPAFITGLLSIAGSLISLVYFSITDIIQPIGFPELQIIPNVTGLRITYFHLIIGVFWIEFLTGLVITILEYGSGPRDHLMRIQQKFTNSKP